MPDQTEPVSPAYARLQAAAKEAAEAAHLHAMHGMRRTFQLCRSWGTVPIPPSEVLNALGLDENANTVDPNPAATPPAVSLPPATDQTEPVVTVHAAPNLSPEAAEALGALVDVAKKQAVDQTERRDRYAALFRSPPGGERLGDATPGEIADAVMAVADAELQAERERLFAPLHRAEADNAKLRARVAELEQAAAAAVVAVLPADQRAATLRWAADALPEADLPFVPPMDRRRVSNWLRRMAGEEPHTTETPQEDPARIDRLRPEFTEHSSVESIDVQLRRARSQERRWHIRTEWLIGLRQRRTEQQARGEWPAASAVPAAPDTEAWAGATELAPDRVITERATAGLVGYRQNSGRLLHCLAHKPAPASRWADFHEVTASDLSEGGICVHPDCGRDLLAPWPAASGTDPSC